MSAAYIMIVAGSISTTLSFIGLVGAIKVFLFKELIEEYYLIDVICEILLFTKFIFFLFAGNQVPFTFIFHTSFPHVCCPSSRGCDSLCF